MDSDWLSMFLAFIRKNVGKVIPILFICAVLVIVVVWTILLLAE